MTKNDTFLKDIEVGLTQDPKHISSHYFYDKKGDELFQQIMQMPEYYLTKAESEIFQEQSSAIIKALHLDKNTEFELIELGAGDGEKTKHLLQSFLKEDLKFSYIPVDISQNALTVITDKFQELFPDLEISAQQGDYFKVLDQLFVSDKPKVILFIGSNLGNMNDDLATSFLNKIAQNLKSNERLLLGIDQIKSKEIVLPAYNDKAGITRDFNLNLLKRINAELGADFDLQNFEHAPEYLEEEGIAKSFLKSKIKQTVFIDDLGKSFDFQEGELIHTEISRKYNDEILNEIIVDSGLEITEKLMDRKNFFADYILTKK